MSKCRLKAPMRSSLALTSCLNLREVCEYLQQAWHRISPQYPAQVLAELSLLAAAPFPAGEKPVPCQHLLTFFCGLGAT
jgi:hypothetical protein